ncbi:MAG: GTP 3',8-cyclase MoaA [Flavobacteriales bacterium]
MLTDSFGRNITYLRLAVTDRCNLRCLYCMPEKGLQWQHRTALLSFEEIMRLLRIAAQVGITKVRFTGGEPFLRKDFMLLLRMTMQANLFRQVSITTNGTHTGQHIPELKQLGIHSVNLSADTLNAERFKTITRRDDLNAVRKTLDALLYHGITTRINAVVMQGKNEEDIAELTALTKALPVDVRFIEEMPFNGSGQAEAPYWNHTRIVQELEKHFGPLQREPEIPGSTSVNYNIPGHLGRVGVIPAYTRSFCGTCNRLRITPTGALKTCLYGKAELDLRGLMRSGDSDEQVAHAIHEAVLRKSVDGFVAEEESKSATSFPSMATIGG